MINKTQFINALIDWYKENKRDLPFRKTKNPYHIWISEIMLQQTQVSTVIPYYNRFVKRYPTIFDLANSQEEEVLKYFEGLGYYSRAKHLYITAKEIVSKYNGKFPRDYKTIISLKGIGSYTAGAISAIAFNQVQPAVDGNVMRVLSRVLSIRDDISMPKTKSKFETIEKELMSKTDPSSFTQGLMELGALICKPKGQMCQICPVNQFCSAYQNGDDHLLPIKTKKTKQKRMKLIMVIIKNEEGKFLVKKRKDKGLLANFYELVQFETKNLKTFKSFLRLHDGIYIHKEKYLGKYQHVFTHLIWDIKAYSADVKSYNLSKVFKWVDKKELKSIPLITAHKKVMNDKEGLL